MIAVLPAPGAPVMMNLLIEFAFFLIPWPTFHACKK
jgi:hypothetical protein